MVVVAAGVPAGASGFFPNKLPPPKAGVAAGVDDDASGGLAKNPVAAGAGVVVGWEAKQKNVNKENKLVKQLFDYHLQLLLRYFQILFNKRI